MGPIHCSELTAFVFVPNVDKRTLRTVVFLEPHLNPQRGFGVTARKAPWHCASALKDIMPRTLPAFLRELPKTPLSFAGAYKRLILKNEPFLPQANAPHNQDI